jgi:hypothetical protein
MRRQRPEQAIQRAVLEHLRRRGVPDIFVFHPANGGARSPIEAAIFRSLGVVAGTPDLIIIRGGVTHALELKAAGGKLTPAQIDCHEAMRRAGATVAVAHGVDQAIDFLEQHNLLKRTTRMPPPRRT